MHIAVVGSFPSEIDERWPLIGTPEEFREACTSIGVLLAKDGHELSVQHDREDSADLYVAQGYVARAIQTRLPGQRITVWCPRRGGPVPFIKQAKQHPTLFSIENADTGKWDSARFKMCHRAEVTIMVGGQARSETTGMLVLAAGKLLVPITSFGGAAASLLPEVEQRFLNAQSLPSPLLSTHLKEFWSESLLERIGAALGNARPKLIIIHGRDMSAVEAVVAHISSELKWGMPQIMVWDYRPGETLVEKWERLAGAHNTIAIAIASADDEGRFRNEPLRPRARQNVWLELGWFWGKYHNRRHLLILHQSRDGQELEMPSDLAGLEKQEWTKTPLECKDHIRRFLSSFG